MSKLTDRSSYLKGMAAGMKLNMEKDANKLMLEMLTVMGEMAEEMAGDRPSMPSTSGFSICPRNCRA